MKKRLVCLLVCLALSLSLCACDLTGGKAPSAVREVLITAGPIQSGMTAKDVFVEVTIDHQPVACRVILTAFEWDGYYEMAEDEPVPEDFCVRLDVFYSLPDGCDVDDINVTMVCDGGVYDGTGSVSFDDQGRVEAWSHAFYENTDGISGVYPVHIRVGTFEPGMPVSEVRAEVTVNDKPVESRIGVIHYTEEGERELEMTDVIPDHALVRLDVYYYLEYGMTLENIDVSMDFPDGWYHSTGSIRCHEDGRVEAWSYGFFDSREEKTHIHIWTEQESEYPYNFCTTDIEKTYVCDCGETMTEIVPAPGHDLREVHTTPPTCTEAGSQTTSCKQCGAGFVVEIPPTGHSWSGWSKATGRMHERTCSVCGAVEQASHNIPAGSVTCTDCGADIIN